MKIVWAILMCICGLSFICGGYFISDYLHNHGLDLEYALVVFGFCELLFYSGYIGCRDKALIRHRIHGSY